jgi:hypothetical protein
MDFIKRLDYLSKAIKLNEAFENKDVAQVAIILGMTPEICDPMTGSEIMDAIQVRLADFTREWETYINVQE